MRKEKIEEGDKHLAKMDELLKAQGDISFLCESVCKKIVEINLLRSKLIMEVKEKVELCGEA